MTKQVIVVRKDLEMSSGKLAVQVAHASVGAMRKALDADPRVVSEWSGAGGKKIVCAVEGESELTDVSSQAQAVGIPTFLVRDRGLTELPPGTTTCVGLGPAEEELLDEVTGSLPLLK